MEILIAAGLIPLSVRIPEDVAVTPDGKEVYIVNNWTSGSTVNVLDRAVLTLLPASDPNRLPTYSGCMYCNCARTSRCSTHHTKNGSDNREHSIIRPHLSCG